MNLTNSLFVDDSKISFKNKVKYKFSSQMTKILVNVKGKEIVKLTYVSQTSFSLYFHNQ